MYKSNFEKRVRYGETDKMGYLYYGNYAQLYEIGRVELLRELGLPYAKMEDELGIMLPVVSLEARFLKPAYYDELLTIESSLRELPTKMITIHSEILNSEKILIHKARVSLFFVDMESGKRISAPEALTARLSKHFTN